MNYMNLLVFYAHVPVENSLESWLDFFSTVIESSAWPLATFFIACLFRDPIKNIINSLKSFEAYSIILKFNNTLNDSKLTSHHTQS